MNTPHVGIRPPLSGPMTPSPTGWAYALLAIVVPTLIAVYDPPSVTFYNQVVAVLGWGLMLAWFGRARSTLSESAAPRARSAVWALGGMMAVLALAAFGEGLFGELPVGLSLMGGSLSVAALFTLLSGWHLGRSPSRSVAAELFFGALAVAGAVGLLIAAIQVFMPSWADGSFIATPNVAGRAVGNLRQPNHFSTLLVFAAAASVWLGAHQRVKPYVAAVFAALCIGGIVLTASRTGMVAMVFLTAWGLLGRRLPRVLRFTLIAAPLIYGAWWGGMWVLSHADRAVAFAGEARLHDGSDISSSRFAIWANVLSLIQQHPWRGVGYGEFNLAWTLTPFPDRPVAFFDHTHNLILQWAVELGLPAAALLTLLALWGFWCLVRPDADIAPPHGDAAAVGAAGVIVATAGLHSLLEYPLWYTYFLLPTAFAWGVGLAARAPAAQTVVDTRRPRVWLAGGVVMAVMAVWCALDYQAAANIYAPRPGAGPLEQRIALSQPMPWWGYQADYAKVTAADPASSGPAPAAFKRTIHNLMDARLMMAYARSLAAHGEVDKARYVAARLREFRNASAKPFFEACRPAPTSAASPFQCLPPKRAYTWKEILP